MDVVREANYYVVAADPFHRRGARMANAMTVSVQDLKSETTRAELGSFNYMRDIGWVMKPTTSPYPDVQGFRLEQVDIAHERRREKG